MRVRVSLTHVRPDMTKLPVAGAVQRTFEDNVPLAGPMAKAMRNTGEAMMGKVFEGVHALMAGALV